MPGQVDAEDALAGGFQQQAQLTLPERVGGGGGCGIEHGRGVHALGACNPRARLAAPGEARLDRVQGGDTDWFTKPMIASYHTVWFELHEDLLCTLGIERGSEGEG